MATVYRGLESRIAGALYGALLVAGGAGLYLVVDVPPARRQLQLIVAGFAGLLALVGLFNVGKAVFQSDYRIVINLHRGDVHVEFGRRIFG